MSGTTSNASRISLQEAQALPDILSDENWRLQLGPIPGSSDSSALEIKCQNTAIPGRENQHYPVPLGGFIRTFRGRNRFGQNMFGAAFVEDITRDTWIKLYGWLEQIDGTNSGTAIGDTTAYTVNAELTLFDQAGNSVDTYQFYKCYIVGLTDINLQLQQSQPILINCEFAYDYYLSSTVAAR